jgi:hypothetical protein
MAGSLRADNRLVLTFVPAEGEPAVAPTGGGQQVEA